jgi:hypothetical protein
VDQTMDSLLDQIFVVQIWKNYSRIYFEEEKKRKLILNNYRLS